MAKQAIKKATDEKILERSLKLFNERGVHSVSAHDIANELGISSGNLTYYFKRKTDIVNALVDRLEADLSQNLNKLPLLKNNPQDHGDLMIGVLSVLWRYRFFFNNINYLTNQDASQLARYKRIKAVVTDNLNRLYSSLIDNGSLLPVEEPEIFDLIIDNAWFLLLSHLRLYLVETPTRKLSAKGYYRFASLHYYASINALYTPEIRRGLLEYLNAKFDLLQ
jgi:AcrR family transcriptional regulator